MWRWREYSSIKHADGGALGVEHRQARADLGGEREQVELGPDAAVVAPLGLLEAVEVLGQRLVGLPGRAVDALQLGAVLVAAPVGAGHPQELEVPEPTRRRHVGAPAQVDELAVAPTLRYALTAEASGAMSADGLGRELGVGRRAGDALDDLALEGLVGEQRQALVDRVLLAHEAPGRRP